MTDMIFTYEGAETAFLYEDITDWETLTRRLPRNEVPYVLELVADYLDTPTLREAVITAWCMAEFPERYVDREAWIGWFRQIGYTEAVAVATPPQAVTLYRGGTEPDRMAWTGDRAIAEWFRDRPHNQGQGRLWTTTVSGDTLLAHITHVRNDESGRGEDEYIIDPTGLVYEESR